MNAYRNAFVGLSGRYEIRRFQTDDRMETQGIANSDSRSAGIKPLTLFVFSLTPAPHGLQTKHDRVYYSEEFSQESEMKTLGRMFSTDFEI